MLATTKTNPTIWTKPWHWYLGFDAALHNDETAHLRASLVRAHERVARLETAHEERTT